MGGACNFSSFVSPKGGAKIEFMWVWSHAILNPRVSGLVLVDIRYESDLIILSYLVVYMCIVNNNWGVHGWIRSLFYYFTRPTHNASTLLPRISC